MNTKTRPVIRLVRKAANDYDPVVERPSDAAVIERLRIGEKLPKEDFREHFSTIHGSENTRILREVFETLALPEPRLYLHQFEANGTVLRESWVGIGKFKGAPEFEMTVISGVLVVDVANHPDALLTDDAKKLNILLALIASENGRKVGFGPDCGKPFELAAKPDLVSQIADEGVFKIRVFNPKAIPLAKDIEKESEKLVTRAKSSPYIG